MRTHPGHVLHEDGEGLLNAVPQTAVVLHDALVTQVFQQLDLALQGADLLGRRRAATRRCEQPPVRVKRTFLTFILRVLKRGKVAKKAAGFLKRGSVGVLESEATSEGGGRARNSRQGTETAS